VLPEQLESLAAAVERTAWSLGPEVQSEQVGLAVLEALRDIDDVAAVRFASVYKGFEEVDDFARELGLLSREASPADVTDATNGDAEQGRSGQGAPTGGADP
jgi:transcriptional repressor NrdR